MAVATSRKKPTLHRTVAGRIVQGAESPVRQSFQPVTQMTLTRESTVQALVEGRRSSSMGWKQSRVVAHDA